MLWEASSHISEIVFPISGHPATDGSGGGITSAWSLNWVARLCIPSTSDFTSKAVGSSRMTNISRVTVTAASIFLFPNHLFTIAKKGCRTVAMMAPQITGSRKGRMIPMHQAMSTKRTTILRMVSIKGNSTRWFIRLPLTFLSLTSRRDQRHMTPLRYVVGAGVLAVTAALVGAMQVVANDGGPAAGATRVQHQVLGQHLGFELPAFRQVLQLAADRVEVVGGQARIDRLGVFLQDPDRAAGLAQQDAPVCPP